MKNQKPSSVERAVIGDTASSEHETGPMESRSTEPMEAADALRAAASMSGSRKEVRPLDLANYLRERGGDLAEAWSEEISSRGLGQGTPFDRIVGRFMSRLVAFLPWLVGPHSPHVQPLWHRTAELFGVMAAKRGLAAGEVIEEFQILRALLIRTLHRDPPAEGPLSLRDTLRLHGIVDSGVTYASVGHTDAMFFQFLEAQEAQVAQTPDEIVREADAQLSLVEEELAEIVETTPVEAASNAVEN